MLSAGDPLPTFAATAAVSGARIDNAWLAGRKGLLVVHGVKSADAAKTASKELHARGLAGKVAFASIVDLRPMSGLWRKVAEAQLKSTYSKLAEKASAAGLDPAATVIICPDWDGTVCSALGVADPDGAPQVIAADGRKVLGVFPAKGPAAAAIDLVAR